MTFHFVHSHKFMLDSNYYYAKKYMNIGILQLWILKIVGNILLLKIYIIKLFKSK